MEGGYMTRITYKIPKTGKIISMDITIESLIKEMINYIKYQELEILMIEEIEVES